jgi:hypothetical protein
MTGFEAADMLHGRFLNSLCHRLGQGEHFLRTWSTVAVDMNVHIEQADDSRSRMERYADQGAWAVFVDE